MRFLRGKPKDKESIKPGGVKVTDHRQFVELVRKLMKVGGCKIDVYQRETPSSLRSYLTEQPPDGVLNVENYPMGLLENHGPGVYDHEVYDIKGVLAGSYQLTVGKPKLFRSKSPEEKEAAKAAAKEKADAKNLSGGNNELILKLMEIQNQGALSAKDVIELVKNNGNGKTSELDNEFKLALYQKALDGNDDGGALEVFLKALEYAKTTMTPNIESQDPLTAVIAAIGPGIMQMLAAKSGAQLPQAVPIAGTNTPVQPPAAPPPADAVPGLQLTADQDAFYRYVIIPYRFSIENEKDPEEIRNKTMTLISTALDQAGDDPHPLLAELVEKWRAGDLVGLDSAIDTFFSLIPEIKGNKGLQQAVKESFLELAVQPDSQQAAVEPTETEVKVTDIRQGEMSVGDDDIAGLNSAMSDTRNVQPVEVEITDIKQGEMRIVTPEPGDEEAGPEPESAEVTPSPELLTPEPEMLQPGAETGELDGTPADQD